MLFKLVEGSEGDGEKVQREEEVPRMFSNQFHYKQYNQQLPDERQSRFEYQLKL